MNPALSVLTKSTNGVYSIVSTINRSEVNLLGDYTEITDENDGTFASDAAVELYLTGLFVSTSAFEVSGGVVETNNPLPISEGSVFESDIDFDNSDFTGWTGTPENLFKSPFSGSITNATANNPKQIILAFKRTVKALQIGLGENNGGNFSNVKISLLGSGGTERSIFDQSTDNTDKTSLNAEFENEVFNSIKIEFFTADTVSLSNIIIFKGSYDTVQIQGQKPNGDFSATQLTKSGNLKTTDAENGLAIAMGSVSGTTFVHKFGKAPDFDIADGFVTVWDGADDGDISQMDYVYSTSAIIDSLSSSSASDTQDIEVQGLDSDYNLVVQTVTLNGQTRVPLTTNLIRVFRLVNQNGTDIVGSVYCYENTPLTGGVPNDSTKVRAVIEDGNNQTLMAVYTIPAGHTGYLRKLYAGGGNVTGGFFGSTPSSSEIRLFVRPFGKVFQLKYDNVITTFGMSVLQNEYVEPEVITEKSDIELKCNTTSNASSISGGFDLVLVQNS